MNSDLDPSAALQMECYIVLCWKSSFMRLIAVFGNRYDLLSH